MKIKVFGETLSNMPWEDRPEGCSDVLWRSRRNPILGRKPVSKGSRVFNSAVASFGSGFVGVFRIDHKNGRPQLHVGYSEDGFSWNVQEEEIHWIDPSGKPFPTFYAYDPRLVKIENTYYVTFCTDDHGPTIGVATTKDFKTFVRLPNAFVPCNRNGVLFPRKVNGVYLMLNRPSDMGHTPFGDIFLSESSDMIHWGNHRWVMGRSSENWWENLKIGAGPAPIETSEGWLLFYHGVTLTCNGYVYNLGAVLLDLEEPWEVLHRCKYYLLTPEERYEVCGFVPNVVFPCAALCDVSTNRIAIYYGAADTHVAIAFGYVDEIVDYVISHS